MVVSVRVWSSLEHRCKYNYLVVFVGLVDWEDYNYWPVQKFEMASHKWIEVLVVRIVAWMIVVNRKNSLVVAQEWEDYKNNHFDSAAFEVFPIIQLVC